MSNTRAFSSVIAGVLVLVLVVKAQDVRGTPGVDYPNYSKIPKTSFSCSEQKYIPGLYADMETGCQGFHFCDENVQESFLCPPGMTFNQASLACGSWDNFNCSLTPQFYSVNTGPEMDNARRNILMVLQLKNRSRSKLSNRPSDVYAKITSLYDGTVGEEQSESPDVAVGINAESNDGVGHEVESEEMPEEALERSEENGYGFNQDLSGIDESTLNDESAYISEESEHTEPEIFYDPVTEKYYVDYDPLQTANEVSKEEFDKVGSLSYDEFSERFGLPYKDVDEIQSDSESEYSKENDKELSEMLAREESEEQLLKTMWNAQSRTLKRVRRRPLYRVVKEDTAAGITGVARGLEYPIDSTDTPVNFEFSPITSEGNQRPEKAAPEVSYEVPELQYSNIASTGNPGVPQTLEFDQAVLSELSIPEDNKNNFWKSVPTEDEKDESMKDDSQTYQTADEYSYIENRAPVDYESYFTDYTEIAGEPEFVPETRGDESNNWYQDESLGSEDSVEPEDTYVVIPDEYDNAFDKYSETNGQTETYSDSTETQSDATGQFDSSRDFSQSYISPAVYAPVAPYWLPPPYFYPDGYGSRQAFNTEHFFNRDSFESPEYVGRPPNDQDYQYFPLADSSIYAYESPNFPGHVYDYGTDGYVYPYANVYGSPYAEKFGYDTSEVKVVTESTILNENLEAAVAGNSDYSEPEMQYWAESFSTESPEIEEVTESVFPTKESLDNVYITSDGELDEMPSSTSDAPFDENMKEAETFYLFDFDENSDEEVIPDATDEVLDNIQFTSNGLFQAEEPSRRNESSGDLEGVNVGIESDSTGAQAESDLEFDRENSKRLGLSETAENEKSIDSTFQTEGTSHENLVPSSASGTTAVNTPQTHSRRQPRSYDSNKDLSRDSKFLMDNIYSESNFRLQDAVLAQPYGVEDESLQSNMEDGFFHRTGNAGLSRASKLSELQKRILSLKQGKLGTFKKYMNPGGKD